MKTVFSEDHRLQDGKSELIDGKLLPCFEMPRRAEIVLARVREQKLGEILPPRDFGLDPVRRVHRADFVDFLAAAWERWVETHGTYDALPLNWRAPGMRRIVPTTIDGQLSHYSFDAGTPITAGTWRAITASANVALTGQALVAAGAPAAFALCRPPGHHAGSDYYGGYCFLNNAAIAAQAFRDGGAGKVAVLDVDYHHGNGTQEIFYDRGDVLFASIHADPRQEYPFFLGHADEPGDGAGAGCNLNLPLPWGTGWSAWRPALEHALSAIGRFGAEALVVSLGVDTFEHDPISQFKLVHEDYLRMGALIAGAGLPTLFVMEGGYAVDALGVNAVNVLTGFEGAGAVADIMDAIEEAARRLTTARLAGRRIEMLPADCRPADEAAAYAVQAAAHTLLTAAGRGALAGWKIGCTTPVMQRFLDIHNPCAGGMLAGGLHRGHADLRHADYIKGAVECEIAVRLAADLPGAGAPYDRHSVAPAVAACMAAIELVDDRYDDYRSLGTPTLIADDFFHVGCVLAPPVEDWNRLDLPALVGTTTINGSEVGRGRGGDVMGHPFAALAWLANSLAARGRGLRRGETVLTGSVVETRWVNRGDRVTIRIDGLGEASATFA